MAKKKNLINIPQKGMISLLYILLGILLIVLKQAIIEWAMFIFGILFVAQGIVNVIKKAPVVGAFQIIIGVLLIVFRFIAQNLVMIIFGILLAVSGLSQLANGGYKKTFPLLTCILSIIGGVLIALNSSSALSVVYVITGVIFIVDGVIALIDKK